jgi:uncharacterized protein
MTVHAPNFETSRASAAIAFPAPAAAVSLYVGDVMHQRMRPKPHRFTYRVFNILIDLDRLDDADRQSKLFGVNRAAVTSFHESDHIDGPYDSARSYVDHLLNEAGLTEKADRILLACYPRVFGRVFNPLAVYYAYDRYDVLKALIYEVRNTFGERHSYVCVCKPGDVSPAGIRQERNKRFFVSPFIDMEMRYHFRMLPPAEAMRWRILETDSEGPFLSATFDGERTEFTSRAILECLLRVPFQTLKIVAGIHFEALRLWLKGARYRSRGPAPVAVSFDDDAA